MEQVRNHFWLEFSEELAGVPVAAGVVAIDCQNRSFLPERIFVLPQGEPCAHIVEACGLLRTNTCTEVAASCEVPPGRLVFPHIFRVNSAFGANAIIIA
jgi:hypothetical protein